MNSDTLTSIIQQVQSAQTGSRELDALIAQAVGAPHGRKEIVHVESRSYEIHDEIAAYYTSSLDAALRLKPSGWRIAYLGEWNDERLREMGAYQAILQLPGEGDHFGGDLSPRCDHAASLELAFCSAALQAHRIMLNSGE